MLIRYPVEFSSEVESASVQSGVSRELIYAVIWTESKFIPNAKSGAGAVGLMQLLPATAEWLCEMDGISYNEQMLTDPRANTFLGARYLAFLLERFDKSDALAAYNAGPGNVKKWRENGISEYPFKETRDYVERVLNAERIYKLIKPL